MLLYVLALHGQSVHGTHMYMYNLKEPWQASCNSGTWPVFTTCIRSVSNIGRTNTDHIIVNNDHVLELLALLELHDVCIDWVRIYDQN